MAVRLYRNNGLFRANIALFWVLAAKNMVVILNVCTFLAIFYFGSRSLLYTVGRTLSGIFEYYPVVHHLLNGISIVLFLIWFYRSYANLYRISKEGLYARGWTIAAWFIPIVHLFLPYRVMRNMFRRTAELTDINDAEEQRLSRRRLVQWWSCWIAVRVISETFTVVDFFTQVQKKYPFAMTFVALGMGIIGLMTCMVTIRLFRRYETLDRRLRLRYDENVTENNEMLDA